ncbi:site-specific integrase [Heyndrickxia sporothermodurans]|uniref:tyrosine-type recombinase/integrase n=1 Tax=Heyndrickxia sporothermodurans TaxID=46224 RepID=UPI002DBB285D|nr:tyrosine-type recombinase/integrase [Heyndrickxia sporothermodurans]MEB6549681.1 site-specific integrase [Heyndrickxia sporothermodurans]
MRVQEVLLEEGGKRYMLIDDDAMPVLPVLKYLKYLDTTGKSTNTQKTYCYALKQYFTFLIKKNIDYKSIKMEDLVDFVGWLRNPYESLNTIPISETPARKTEGTINLTITAVTSFYNYLYRNEEMDKDIANNIMQEAFNRGHRHYKDFLYHVNKSKSLHKNILKIKKKRSKIKTLTKEEVGELIKATNNTRDRLLLQTLFETGIRIGELLSLYIEDFVFDHKNGHRIRLVERGELQNGARLKTGGREIFVSQELMDLFDDYLYETLDEMGIDNGFVFIKLRGEKTGQPMDYHDVSALFKRLRKKSNISVHPHLLRHTHATLFYKQTGDIKQVQERLGHSNIQTTMDLYLHPSKEDLRNNWEIAQNAFKIYDKNSKGEKTE